MFWTTFFLGSLIYYQPYRTPDNGGNNSPYKNSKENKNSQERSYTYNKPVLEKTQISGSLNKNQVTQTLEKNSQKLKSCFYKKSPKKINMDFEINKEGSVQKKSLQGKKDPTEKCIAQIIQEINFPKTRDGEITKVRQSFGDPTVKNEGYSGLQNHFCKVRVLNWLIYARIKIKKALDETHYIARLDSIEKIICEYAQNFPIKTGQDFILRTEEKLDSEKNCAFLPLARTWQIYDSNGLDNIISLWVWKIAPRSFLVDQLYELPIFSKCKR
jgi:hypothetical protein